MIEPLNQFADRIIRNGEVHHFIMGLMEKGVSRSEIELSMFGYEYSHNPKFRERCNEVVGIEEPHSEAWHLD